MQVALAKALNSLWPSFLIWEWKTVSPRPPPSSYSVSLKKKKIVVSVVTLVCFLQNTLKYENKYKHMCLVSESGSRERILNTLMSHSFLLYTTTMKEYFMEYDQ